MGAFFHFAQFVIICLGAYGAYSYRREAADSDADTIIGFVIIVAVALYVVFDISVGKNNRGVTETILLLHVDRGTLLLSAMYGLLIGFAAGRVSLYIEADSKDSGD
jgi:hypothetical protein